MNDLSEIQYYTYCLGKLSCFFFFSYWQNDKTLSKPVFRVISVWLASSQIFIHDLTLNTSELHINYTCVQLSIVTYLFLFVNYYTCLVGYFNLKGDLREVICQCHFCSIFFFFKYLKILIKKCPGQFCQRPHQSSPNRQFKKREWGRDTVWIKDLIFCSWIFNVSSILLSGSILSKVAYVKINLLSNFEKTKTKTKKNKKHRVSKIFKN